MKFPESWLRSFVDPPLSSSELAHALTMGGLEVEETEPAAPPFTGIVVGEIKSFEKHPNADRLNVCQVDAGQEKLLNIVCGAPNVAAGMKVPCALIGALLPAPSGSEDGNPSETGKPFEIKRAKMRGVESEGMLCSARELGMSEDHSGLLPLPADATIGADVRKVLNLDDTLLTIKLTPNRADALSVLGVARDVAAITSAPFMALGIAPVQPALDDKFPAKISDPDGCGRFTGRVIKGVNANAPTPRWMVERLARSGQRSISALVDVTNYVMLELGRPLHVYDLDKLKGGIDVRFGRKGEQVKLLNEQTVELDQTVLAITDGSGPIGLAGIMGGDSTKAELDSTNVYLESAFFYPLAIQGRARKYNFTSDASHRFERGVDFNNNVDGIERATRLIVDICGGQAGPTVDTVAKLPVRKPVTMRIARCVKIIGKAISAEEMAATFTRLGFTQTREGDGFIVTPPSYRFDIEIEEDLIEEVARIHGFENIPALPPLAHAEMMQSREDRISSDRAQGTGRRARLPGNDQLFLCRGKVGARAGRQREPDQAAQPDRQPDGGDALLPVRLADRQRRLQPQPPRAAGAGVRSRRGVPARRRRKRRAAASGRLRAAAHARRDRLSAPPTRSNGARTSARSTSST